MNRQVNSKLMLVIEKLGLAVSPADVCRETGTALVEVTQELNQLAADTAATLEVSSAGQVVYRFKPGFRQRYASQGLTKALEQSASFIVQLGYFLLRFGFGTILIISLAILALIILVCLVLPLLLASGSSRASSGNPGVLMLAFLIGPGLGGLLSLFAWDYQQSQTYKSIGISELIIDDTPKKPFVVNCFSFLFGDGNPNPDLEERKWAMVAQLIEAKNGVVTADDLAPFTAADPKDDSAVLPVLVRFQGRPEVTDSGNIIYVFPSLTNQKPETALPKLLEEKRWLFTERGFDSIWPVWFYASINFAGWWIVHLFFKPGAGFTDFAHIAQFMLGYSIFFLVVPFIRYCVISYLNVFVDDRNAYREEYAGALAEPDEKLLLKQSECDRFRQQEVNIAPQSIVYSTDRDIIEQ